MGVGIWPTSRLDDSRSFGFTKNQKSQNPDSNNWTILRSIYMKPFLIIEIFYPDCGNYEGKKIIVFQATLSELQNQIQIDPHFGQNKNMLYPIARFQPTEEGWNDAYNYIMFKKVLQIAK